jgi:hypothetical protein
LLFPGIVSALAAEESRGSSVVDPLAAAAPQFPARAKRVIFLFMSGGVSHVETWDPKPQLVADAGKTLIPGAEGELPHVSPAAPVEVRQARGVGHRGQ